MQALLSLACLEAGLALFEAAYLFGLARTLRSWSAFRPVAVIWASVLVAALVAVMVTALHRAGRGPRWGACLAVAVPPALAAAAIVVRFP